MKEIVVGSCYVNDNELVIRAVVEETDAHHVKFNAFELATGRLIPAPHRICHKRRFARWADREASEAEAARTRRFNTERRLEAHSSRLLRGAPLDRAKTAISGAPEQLLLPRAK